MANTMKGRAAYICTTAKPTDLTQVQYEALAWVAIGNIGSVGELGTATNVVSYDELNTDVVQKQKGISNAGDPVIECSRNVADAGQIALRAAALTKSYYAIKVVDDDQITPTTGKRTTYYNRGLITGPVRPGGRNEDFIIENYTIGLVQREIVDNAT